MNSSPNRVSQTEVEPVLTCKVCRKLFNRPILLNCLHSVCGRCTKEIIEGDHYYCPECHCATECRDQLCPNPYIEDVINKLNLLNSVCPECGQNKCEIWCTQCDNALCKQCSDRIHTFKTNKSHERQFIRRMRSLSKDCQVHPAYAYTHFCNTCNVPICLSCIIDHHKDHDYLLLESHNLTLVNEIQDNLKELQDCEVNREKSREMISLNIDHMTPHYDATRDQVKTYFGHLRELLDAKEAEILDDITTFEKDETQKIDQEQKELKSESYQYKSTIQIVDKLLTSAPSDVAVMCDLIIARLKDLPHYDTSVQTDKRGLCSFIWETTIESVINSFSIMNQGVQPDVPQNMSYSQVDPFKTMLSSLNSVPVPYNDDPFNGIFHFLGQKAHSTDIINPAYIGECTITSSSLLYGMLPLLLASKPVTDTYCVTKDEGSNWVMIGFSKYYVIPQLYSLICLPNSVYPSPTSWVFEASKTGTGNDWETLYEHVDDATFTNTPFYGVWNFDNRNYYSFIRIRTAGQPLLLSGIEIFGTLIPKQKTV